MEDSENMVIPPDNLGERKQPVILIAQLMRNVAQMRHVDEVFVWLSNALVRYLDLPVVQFWMTEADNKEHFRGELRAVATMNGLIPQEMHLNNQVLDMVEHLFHTRRSVRSLPIQGLFSPLQVSLFTVYDLHYWAGYFLDSDALFTPTRTAAVSKPISTSFTVIVSLFTEVPLSADQTRAIHFILKQAMRIIVNRKLLTIQEPLETARQHTAKEPSIALVDIIPTRSQDVRQFQAANPFAHASIIADRKARRLYSAVDGYRSVAALAQVTGFAQKELIEALRYLSRHQKIEFYTSKGERVEHISPILSASE